VVLCAYTEQRWSLLCNGLTSVLAQSPQPHQAIVVIDHNDDLLRRTADTFPEVDVVANAGEKGLSDARNTGVDRASGEVVAFLDDDAAAEPGWLAALSEAYSDPHVIATGGSVLPRWSVPMPRWFPEEFLWVVGCSYRGAADMRIPIRNPIGANMSVRRELCVAVGGFNTGLGRIGSTPLGCEETELAIRMGNASEHAVVQFVPAARVHHDVPPERGQWSYYVSRCWSEGLSKAIVARLVGTSAGLATERRYTRQVLPRGFAKAIGEGLRGDWWGLLRAGAIVAGISVTAAGFVRGWFVALPPSVRDASAAGTPNADGGQSR
jgi:hypothetical protein